MIFAVCGGDGRLVRLAGLLLADGHAVRAWALEDAPLAEGVRLCESAAECCAGADCAALPMPLLDSSGFLNAPYSAKKRCLTELAEAVGPGTRVFAGGANAAARAEFSRPPRDYAASEAFRALNSLATAEGAIAVLLRESEETLCGKRAVITGAGRITRALAPRLAALGLRVTVASRSPARRAWYAALGFGTADTASLSGALGGAEIVVNTAPGLVLGAARLVELPAGAVVLDLASAPGGVDFDAARAFGIHALTAPGLPGKCAPLTAAKALRDAIYSGLEDEKL